MEKLNHSVEYNQANISSELSNLIKLFVALNNGVPASQPSKKAIKETMDCLYNFAATFDTESKIGKIDPIAEGGVAQVIKTLQSASIDNNLFTHDLTYHTLQGSLNNREADSVSSTLEKMINLENDNRFEIFLPSEPQEYNRMPRIKTFVEQSNELKGKTGYILSRIGGMASGVTKISDKKPISEGGFNLVGEVIFDGSLNSLIMFIELYDKTQSNFFFDLSTELQQKYFQEFIDTGRSETLESIAKSNLKKYADPINQKQRFHHAVGLEQLKLSILGLTQVMEGNAKSLSDVDLNDGKFAEITGNIASLNELYSEYPESFNPDAIPEELDYLAWSKIYGEFSAIYKSLEPMFEYFEKNRDQLTADFRKTKAYRDMKKTREEAIQARKIPLLK
jgi:hypothetical protein